MTTILKGNAYRLTFLTSRLVRLEYQPDGLHSHNSKYPVLHFNDDDNVRCIGRVIGIVPIDARPTETEQAELDDLQHEAAQRH